MPAVFRFSLLVLAIPPFAALVISTTTNTSKVARVNTAPVVTRAAAQEGNSEVDQPTISFQLEASDGKETVSRTMKG